ncbi:MAG TPA: tRNA (adenosine(37)-N6)-dimethylallyltransferase MiaA [Acidimicrobiales bacterium]|nr:tRNA (adenosine(37)-N6)-dimethylallyltransferase MiaA [Acidimicrobiales bacterium]
MVGPTAAGKSEVAVAVARALGDVEIVTVDSMQVYRGMDIGTAKPDLAARGGVPHHLLDLADPSEEWTVTRWLAAAREALAAIEGRGRRALLVGGTGLYFRALADGLTPPGRYPQVRAELDADPDTAALHGRLAALDPLAAGRMLPGNRRRVVRALEVTLGSGRPFSSFGPGLDTYPAVPWRIAGLAPPREALAGRIARRWDGMLAAGLLDEVRTLAARPGGLARTARQALGYRELLAHLEDGVPLAAAGDEAVRRTRAFARRQRVWWRRDPRIAWYEVGDNPVAVTARLLGDWSAP